MDTDYSLIRITPEDHWNTRSYAEHKTTDELYGDL